MGLLRWIILTCTCYSCPHYFKIYLLTGTPIENRIDELHSIVAFVDKYKLGPLFKFLHNHQKVDESGKVIGYTELNKVGESIKSILIRRTKQEVLKQLPERLDKNYFVPVTEEQMRKRLINPTLRAAC